MASTTRGSSSAAKRRAVAKARTLETVEELLRDGESFTELSVERIASQAGLSRSTFYLYFQDKTELIVQLAESMKIGTFEAGEDWGPVPPANGQAWLAGFYHHVIRSYRSRGATLAAVLEVAGYEASVREVLDARQQRFIERMTARLGDEQRAGRAAAGMDPALAARVMIVGGEHVIATYVTTSPDDEEADARMAAELAAAHWYGFYRRPSENH